MIGLKQLFKRQSFPLNKILISKSNLLSNYQHLSSLNPDIKIAPVLKSNAYGHGIELVGKILGSQKPPFLCVDSLFEAYQLKKAGVKSQILIMGYIDPRSLSFKRLPFSYTIFDLDFAKALDRYQKGCQVHIFVGTGMSREGVPLKELNFFLSELKKLKNIKVSGLMSHLASADKPSSPQTQRQIQNFLEAKKIYQRFSLTIPGWKTDIWFHLGGSLALLQSLDGVCNLIRAGRGIYGISGNGQQLKPLLELTSKIVQIKTISKGAKVGYSETFVAPKQMLIGILPIGYNDGVDRRLSNKGVVLVDNTKCPIIGLVSMNITTIDLSRVKKPFVGQRVVVFSSDLNQTNSIEETAKICQTIPHDILVHINPFTKREVVD